MDKIKQEQRAGQAAVCRIIWKKAQGEEYENRKYRILRREDTGAVYIGNHMEYMRGNMMQ